MSTLQHNLRTVKGRSRGYDSAPTTPRKRNRDGTEKAGGNASSPRASDTPADAASPSVIDTPSVLDAPSRGAALVPLSGQPNPPTEYIRRPEGLRIRTDEAAKGSDKNPILIRDTDTDVSFAPTTPNQPRRRMIRGLKRGTANSAVGFFLGWPVGSRNMAHPDRGDSHGRPVIVGYVLESGRVTKQLHKMDLRGQPTEPAGSNRNTGRPERFFAPGAPDGGYNRFGRVPLVDIGDIELAAHFKTLDEEGGVDREVKHLTQQAQDNGTATVGERFRSVLIRYSPVDDLDDDVVEFSGFE